jgi:hypothetical protein
MSSTCSSYVYGLLGHEDSKHFQKQPKPQYTRKTNPNRIAGSPADFHRLSCGQYRSQPPARHASHTIPPPTASFQIDAIAPRTRSATRKAVPAPSDPRVQCVTRAGANPPRFRNKYPRTFSPALTHYHATRPRRQVDHTPCCPTSQ